MEDDAKLVFGTIFSMRNMVKKLGGPDDKYAAAEARKIKLPKILILEVKLHILSDWSLQIALLRNANVAQVRHGYGYQDEQFEDCLASDIC